MIYVLLALKIVCLFGMVFYTSVNAARAIAKNATPAVNFIYQALFTTGFITLQWFL